MTPKQLEKAGKTLYGQNWRPHMARALKTTQSTINRWANGSVHVPGPAEAAIGLLQDVARLEDEIKWHGAD